MATTKWALDPTHSEIQFKVKHLMITNVTGSFDKFEASVETEDEDFMKAKISFTADIDSISTGNEQRDGHLKSADFFDVEKYPEIVFEGNEMIQKDEENFVLNGNLTIKSITKEINLLVEFGGLMTDPWGNKKAGFSVTGEINRKDWGMEWNAALEAGGVLVGEKVKILCEVEFLIS